MALTEAKREPVKVAPAKPGEHPRLLVIASQPLSAEELRREVERHADGGEPEVRIVFPALTESPLKHAMGDVDGAIAAADERVRKQLRQAEGLDWRLDASVGDSDPIIALDDALAAFLADEVLLVTRPDEEAVWLEEDMFERAREREHPPLTHVVFGDGGHVRDVEHVDAGPGDPEDAEAEPRSRNLPRYSTRDLAGIVVAVVGSIALAVISSDCPGRIAEGGGTSTACILELLLAGSFALINIAHVIGLMLFTATRYRGPVERFFSTLSLVGTPLAIVATLVISIAAG